MFRIYMHNTDIAKSREPGDEAGINYDYFTDRYIPKIVINPFSL